MIALSVVEGEGRWHTEYVSPQNIARVTEAGVSSQWHGIRSFVRTFDGAVLECAETAQQVRNMVVLAAAQGEAK